MNKQRKSNAYNVTNATESCTILGPYPATVVAALADLGLTDQDIARYFHIQPERITRLRMRSAPELRLVRQSGAAMTCDLVRA